MKDPHLCEASGEPWDVADIYAMALVAFFD
jgi:hypothetical protein